MQNYTLTELIKPNILQQIQDAFSEYSGMASITTDAEGVPVTAGSNFTHFCTDLIRITEAGCKNCFNCDKMGAALGLHMSLRACGFFRAYHAERKDDRLLRWRSGAH